MGFNWKTKEITTKNSQPGGVKILRSDTFARWMSDQAPELSTTISS